MSEENEVSAEAIVDHCMSAVPKALAAGVVDMARGRLLATRTAANELGEGPDQATPARLFEKARGVASAESRFEEILLSSNHQWQYFGRLKSSPQIVLVVYTRSDVNVGLMIGQCRAVAGKPWV